MNTEIYDLIPTNGRKSFYGKAKVIIQGGDKFLKSYDTIHCMVDKFGNVHRFSDYKSNTTCTHLKSFLGDNYNGYWEREIEVKPVILIMM